VTLAGQMATTAAAGPGTQRYHSQQLGLFNESQLKVRTALAVAIVREAKGSARSADALLGARRLAALSGPASARLAADPALVTRGPLAPTTLQLALAVPRRAAPPTDEAAAVGGAAGWGLGAAAFCGAAAFGGQRAGEGELHQVRVWAKQGAVPGTANVLPLAAALLKLGASRPAERGANAIAALRFLRSARDGAALAHLDAGISQSVARATRDAIDSIGQCVGGGAGARQAAALVERLGFLGRASPQQCLALLATAVRAATPRDRERKGAARRLRASFYVFRAFTIVAQESPPAGAEPWRRTWESIESSSYKVAGRWPIYSTMVWRTSSVAAPR